DGGAVPWSLHPALYWNAVRHSTRRNATHKDFSLVQGKQAVLNLKLSGGTANVYVCSSKTKCSFEVRVLRSKSTLASDFFVSSFNAEHNVCTGFAKAALSRSLGPLHVHAATLSNPNVSAKALIEQVHRVEGVQVSQRMGYRVRDAIGKEASGGYQRSCQRLKSLLQEFQTANPTDHVAYEGA
ncbi:hypothetical protein JG688_00009041, partial [Phytophthora aleatoria]